MHVLCETSHAMVWLGCLFFSGAQYMGVYDLFPSYDSTIFGTRRRASQTSAPPCGPGLAQAELGFSSG